MHKISKIIKIYILGVSIQKFYYIVYAPFPRIPVLKLHPSSQASKLNPDPITLYCKEDNHT